MSSSGSYIWTLVWQSWLICVPWGSAWSLGNERFYSGSYVEDPEIIQHTPDCDQVLMMCWSLVGREIITKCKRFNQKTNWEVTYSVYFALNMKSHALLAYVLFCFFSLGFILSCFLHHNCSPKSNLQDMALSDLLQFVFVWMIHPVEYRVITQIMAVTTQACMKTTGYHIDMPTSTHSCLLHHPHLQRLRLSMLSTLHPLWKQLFFFFFFVNYTSCGSSVPFWNVMLISFTCVGVFQLEEAVPSGHWYLQHGGVWCARGRLLTLQRRDARAYLWEAKTNERWMEK